MAKKKKKAPARKKSAPKKPVKKKAVKKSKPVTAKAKVEKPAVHHEVKAAPPEAPASQPPSPPKPERKKILIESPEVLVKDLADKMGLKAGDLIKALMMKGTVATINQKVPIPVIKAVAPDFDYDVDVNIKKSEEKSLKSSSTHDSANLLPRSPVVTIMGHVDHGKTKLLDAVRKTNVVDKEAGGITQHIGAYQVEVKGRKITFLDTPGHEAFTALRARGAGVTDIAVLVVAADDGVMPQTIEAIDHARAAGVPIIVAINKIDKPDANPDKVKKQLAERDLSPEDWGGSTVTVPISAKEGKGIDELLEMIMLVADMQELKADPSIPAHGVVIEAKLDKRRGPVATVLVNGGTLRVGDPIAIGGTSGKVRAIVNDKGASIKEAGPAVPAELLGCSEVPKSGDFFQVTKTDKDAREIAARNVSDMGHAERISLESFSKHVKQGERKDLNLILKADVQGSLEALGKSLAGLSVHNIHVKIIHAAIGSINESDIMLAEASGAIIIGFNVAVGPEATRLAETEGVDVKLYKIIYNVVDDVKMALEGLLEPEYEEVITGTAEVRQLFKFSKVGVIAGCQVLTGKLVRGSKMRIKRDEEVVHEGRLESLKRFKEDVKEVDKGYECGVALMKFENFRVGDAIEVFEMRPKPRKKAKA